VSFPYNLIGSIRENFSQYIMPQSIGVAVIQMDVTPIPTTQWLTWAEIALNTGETFALEGAA
jgi:hypothetical protein